MASAEKTVFISYRRADGDGWAQHLYEKLRDRGFDVFYDVQGLGSGSFAAQLLENVRSRAHFLVLLKPTTLDRCAEISDWMRQEIEEAIAAKRNVVPILLAGFSFSAPNVKGRANSAARECVGAVPAMGRVGAMDARSVAMRSTATHGGNCRSRLAPETRSFGNAVSAGSPRRRPPRQGPRPRVQTCP